MKRAVIAAAWLSNVSAAAAQVTVSLAYCPTPGASTSISGNTTAPSSTTPGVNATLASNHGTYSYQGFYPLPPNAAILNGRSFTGDDVTQASCAAFCEGSDYFAVSNANTCTCGSEPPDGSPIYSPSQTIGCSGNSRESCGSPGYAIVYGLRGAIGGPLPTPEPSTTQPTGQATIGGASSVSSSSDGVLSLSEASTPTEASTSVPDEPPTSAEASTSDEPVASSSIIDGGNASTYTDGSANVIESTSSIPSSTTVPKTSVSILTTASVSTPSSSAVIGGVSSSSAVISSTSSVSSISTSTSVIQSPSTSAASVSSSSRPTSSPASSAGGAGSTTNKSSATGPPVSVTPIGKFDTYKPLPTPPVCPADNNGLRTDPFSVDYGVNCNTNLDGDILQELHADSVDICFQVCDLRKGCVGVSYIGGDQAEANQTFVNCFPYRQVNGYAARDVQATLLVGIGADGVNNATEYQDDVCDTPQNPDDPEIYTDIVGKSYELSCGKTLGTATSLPVTAADSLAGCLTYCSIFDACRGAIFTGNGPPADGETNCQPLAAVDESTAKDDDNSAYGVLQLT